MAPCSFMRVNYVPLTLGVMFSVGLATCYIVAVVRKDVSPYMPFISETGGKYPEAGIFSMFLYLTSMLALSSIFVRFLIVDELNKGVDRTLEILNRATIVIGFIAVMGMIIVAAYPMTTIVTAHNIGADVLFIFADLYAILQTWMSFKMAPYYNGKVICYIRTAITALSTFTLISLLILGPMAFGKWSEEDHGHWSGSKVPQDKGFGLLVGSSVSEWTMAFCFIAYYFSFTREFGKVYIQFNVQLLVDHFDDELESINPEILTERSPIMF